MATTAKERKAAEEAGLLYPEAPPMKASSFQILSKVDVKDKVENKNGLTYLSWAYAWGELKKRFPDATSTVYERETPNGPVNYFTDGRTCWVKTGVTVNGLEHIEMLPVMDYRNNAIPLNQVTSTAVNKAIQRSITKAIARHGLGLNIYAGEDLPEEPKAAAVPIRRDAPAVVTTCDEIPF